MRGSQLARQWKILRLLESRRRGRTVAEISAELDVPIRTVYRDLEAIQEAGFPLYTERINRLSHWKLLEGFKANFPFPLTPTELMSLHMSRDILRVFDGTAFHESIESLFNKVKTSLPPEMIRYLGNISERIKIGFGPTKDYSAFKEIIARISDATAKRRRLEILYKAASTGKDTTRRVDPYQVWAMNGVFYLIGLCHLRDAVRTFAMDRIEKLTILDESFHLPKDFSLEQYLQTAFKVMRGDPETIKIRFDQDVAHVIRERIWHPSQEIREQADGRVEVTLEVPVNYEVISWILGFGSAAEVLQPTSLRKRIKEELAASLKRYRSRADAETKTVKVKKTSGKFVRI